MRNLILYVFVALGFLVKAQEINKTIDQRVQLYLKEMTLEEKVKMLTRNNSSWSYGGCERLGIPAFTCHDGPHGVRDDLRTTAFPTTVARGAAFDRDLSYRLGVAEGKEFRALGWNMRLGNCVDVNRHPLYGRASESAGEDPFLCAEIGAANVLGTQSTGTIANLKHFILNTREDRLTRKNNQAIIDERSLIEIYGYPFKEAIQKGNAWSVMTAHSRVNGLHSTDNPYVLDTLLRDYFGFRYFVLNDWSSVSDVINQGEGSVADVLNAGHDLETNSTNYKEKLADEVRNGNVTMDRLDEAVGKVLRVLLLSGIIDGQTSPNRNDLYSENTKKLVLEGARKSLVLLKNEANILPLTKNKSIALIGPNAAKLPIDGRGSGHVNPIYTVTPLEGITSIAPEVALNYAKGCDINSESKAGFTQAIEAAKNADVVVFVGGLDETQEGEALDRLSKTVQLPGVQQELIKELAKVNKHVVTVIISGGICALGESIDQIQGMLYAFYGGQESGTAIAEALFGEYNPGGKLPVTMPTSDDQLPAFTDDHRDHLLKVGYRWFDEQKIEPQFAFGYGLSYTTFQYSDLTVSKAKTTADKEVTVSFDVLNTGDRKGEEVVQLYIQDIKSKNLMPEKQLKGFERISLEPGETRRVTLTIDAQALSYWDIGLKGFVVEKGEFKIMIGGSSDNLPLQKTFLITQDYLIPQPEPIVEQIIESDEKKMEMILAGAESMLKVNAADYESASNQIEILYNGDSSDSRALKLHTNDWIGYHDVNLGSWLNFVELSFATPIRAGTVELRLDNPKGTLFGTYQFEATGSWNSYQTANIGTSDYGVSGVHDIYFVFKSRPGKESSPVVHIKSWEIEGRKE